MKLNRTKADKKLKLLSWEELDWLEQKCRALKGSAKGARVYTSAGDSTHRAEAVRSYVDHSYDVFEKHHGF